MTMAALSDLKLFSAFVRGWQRARLAPSFGNGSRRVAASPLPSSTGSPSENIGAPLRSPTFPYAGAGERNRLKRGYKGYMKFLILPTMQHVALKDIVFLANYFAGLRGRWGFWTTRKIRMLLKSIFEEAGNDELINKNPMRRLPLPSTADPDKPGLANGKRKHEALAEGTPAESTRLRSEGKSAVQRLKHMRWSLLRRGSRVRGRAREKLNALLASRLATARAWDLKESFRYFWHYKSFLFSGRAPFSTTGVFGLCAAVGTDQECGPHAARPRGTIAELVPRQSRGSCWGGRRPQQKNSSGDQTILRFSDL